MKCPECDGTGKVVHPMMSMNGDEYTGEWEQHECEMCGGTGEFQQTNEEMLRGCTFEEMAGAIYEWYSQGHIEGKVGKQLSSVTRVVEWLKEKRDGNVL